MGVFVLSCDWIHELARLGDSPAALVSGSGGRLRARWLEGRPSVASFPRAKTGEGPAGGGAEGAAAPLVLGVLEEVLLLPPWGCCKPPEAALARSATRPEMTEALPSSECFCLCWASSSSVAGAAGSVEKGNMGVLLPQAGPEGGPSAWVQQPGGWVGLRSLWQRGDWAMLLLERSKCCRIAIPASLELARRRGGPSR